MKKTKLLGFIPLCLGAITLASCNQGFDQSAKITVYTRDVTSGTRDGFFTKISFKEAIKDNTVLVNDYVEVDGNGSMISSIVNDKYGYGYISLSSLADSDLVGLKYAGVVPSEANVINGTYNLSRNFNYIVRANFDSEDKAELVSALVAYMNTQEGKATIKSQDGIVDIKSTDPKWDDIKSSFPVIGKDNSGITIHVGGSTSAEKVAKALTAEFSKKAGNFVAEHNHTGSGDAYKRTQGSEKDGANYLDIGFASREFEENEPASEGTTGKICTDAIVNVVNKANGLITDIDALTVHKIYDGTYTTWNQLVA